MRHDSEQPFGEALQALMAERGLTYRALSRLTREADGKGLTHAHLNMLGNGRERPSVRAMLLIAGVLEVEPEHFAEYRLSAAMKELDPNVVGLEQALENLSDRLASRKGSTRRSGPRQSRGRPRPNP
jgi:transcriptional regulator with XRE-family HTH domain